VKTISCIIPAYNESKSIHNILAVVVPLIGTALHEVIVVDDMSEDTTKAIVGTFPSVQLIAHTENQGKSRTVADGIAVATGEYVFLLDADLLHLTAQNIIDMIEPIQQGHALMTISYRKNAWPLFPFTKIDYLSGERVLPRAFAFSLLGEMVKLSSYGLEVFLNKHIIREQLTIAVVQWSSVENDFQHHKHGFVHGMLNIMKIWWNVLSTVSIIEMYTQNIRLQKLIIK
jgi:glycosyltransferase involved in cell wall biosynthesis